MAESSKPSNPSPSCFLLVNSKTTMRTPLAGLLSYQNLLFLLLRLSQVPALCYYPNQAISGDIPCDLNASVSACCGNEWVCISNGVCEWTNSSGFAHYARGTCTDSEWKSQSCPMFCEQSEFAQVFCLKQVVLTSME